MSGAGPTPAPPPEGAAAFTGPFDELAGLFKLAAPIALAQAGLALMGVVDTAVVGRLGAAPLAGAGLGNGLFFALALFGLGAMMGFDPLFSQAIGAGRTGRAVQLLRQARWLAFFAALVVAVPVAVITLSLPLLGVEPEVAHSARGLLWARLPGLLPLYLFTALRSYLQARGTVRAVVLATVVANVANFLLDLVLVFGLGPIPSLGAAGSGLSTTLCTGLQWVVLEFALGKAAADSEAGLGLAGLAGLAGPAGPARGDLVAALRVGIPFGLQMAAETGVFALVALLAARLGTLQMAAHQVAISLASFTFCFALGVGNAGGVRVGWAVGAGDPAGARRRGLWAFAGGAAIMSVSALGFWLFPGPLARLISDQADVVAQSGPLLAVAAAFQIVDGVQAVGAGVLRGAGDTKASLLANLVGHWVVGLPVALELGYRRGMGVVGLWWGLCAGLAAVALVLLARFWILSARGLRPVVDSVA